MAPWLCSSIFLVLLLPYLAYALAFNGVDLDNATEIELEEYRRHLSEELQRVSDQEKTRKDEQTKKKRSLASPLSASLPNRESSYFLDRMQSLTTKETPEKMELKLIELLNSIDDLDLGSGNNSTEDVTNEPMSTTTVNSSTTLATPLTTSGVPIETTMESSTDNTPTTSSPVDSTTTVEETTIASTTTIESTPTISSSTPTTTSFSTTSTPSSTISINMTETTSAYLNDTEPSSTESITTSTITTAETTSSTTTSTPSPVLTSTVETSEELDGVEEREERREPIPARPRTSFNPTVNHTMEECRHLTQQELVRELKQQGTYNPDLMAWDVFGILRFLDRTITDQYEMQMKNRTRGEEATERNVEALARILGELDVKCDVRTEGVMKKMHNMTMMEPRRSIFSPTLRKRSKREAVIEELTRLMTDLDDSKNDKKTTTTTTTTTTPNPSTTAPIYETVGNRQKLIGESHVVPFGCDHRGTEEDGYLRLCSACQSIRRLPDSFFPPFINEVTCDEDNACLYFYDYPHGRCRQKHMNFVVLRNVGTPECQVWRKFNLNVRVSCECFVDEMSFFAKYV